MFEHRSIIRTDRAVLTHLIRVDRPIRMDKNLISPFEFAESHERTGLAIRQSNMPSKRAVSLPACSPKMIDSIQYVVAVNRIRNFCAAAWVVSPYHTFKVARARSH